MPTKTTPDEDQDTGYRAPRTPGAIWNDRFRKPESTIQNEFTEIVEQDLSDVEAAGNKIINDNADEPSGTSAAIKEREETPDGAYRNRVTKPGARKEPSSGTGTADMLKGVVKAKATPSIVTGILFSGGLGLTTLIGGPATMFGAIVSAATNENNFSASATNIRALKVWSHRIAGKPDSDKVKAACTEPKSIKCASVTMSKKQVDDVKAAEIDLETNGKDVLDKDNEKDSKVGDRYAIEEMKVPTGDLDDKGNPVKETIKAGDDIETKISGKPRLRSMLYKGFNPLTKVFFSSHFNDILSKSFKTDRGDKLKGDDEKGERQSMREALGVEGIEGDENGRASSDEREKAKEGRVQKIKSIGGKFTGKAANAIGTACSIYNGSRAIVTAAKAEKILLMTRLFVVYASEFHRIMDGTSEPQHATFIGDNWNYSENEGSEATNRFYKTTASDAEGMKMIFHGELLNLLTWSRKYMVGGNDALYAMDMAIRTLQTLFPGGKNGLKTACKIGGSALSCAGPQALICIGAAAAMTAAGPLIAKGVEPLMEYAIKELTDLEADDGTVGVDLGNIFAAGAGLAGGRMAQEVGQRPSSKATMQKYRVATAETRQEIAMMYRDQAKSTPFDASNQYSFLGTIAHAIYGQGGTAASLFGNISRTLSVIPASVDVLAKSTNANAAWIMEQNDFQEDQWSKCPDPALQDIGADGSPYCTVGFDSSNETLSMDIDANQKFMIDGGYADPITGEPTGKTDMGGGGIVGSIDALLGGTVGAIKDPADNDKGHKFAMYVKYCARRDQETEGYYGETTEAIESGSSATQLWREGNYCRNAVDDPGVAKASQSGDTSKISLAYGSNTNNRVETLAAASATDGPTREELDNFAAFTMDYGKAGTGTMMDEGNKTATQQPSGDCSELAQQLLDSPNVKFQVEPQQRTYMEQTARDCTQTLDCGGTTQMSIKLLQLLVKAAGSYKITIGAQAAGHQCDNGFHPVGQAVDLNGVRKLDQQPQQMTSWDGGDQVIFKEFYEFLDQNSDVQLELGQSGDDCWKGSPKPTLTNTKFVPDGCNHIHVGVTSP